MTHLIDTLTEAGTLAAAIAGVDLISLSDEQVCQALAAVENLGRYVDALRARSAGEVAARSRRELGQEGLAQRLGFAKGEHLVEHATRVSPAEARRRTRLGSATRARTSLTGERLPAEFPHVAAAMEEGSVGMDAGQAIITCLTQAARTASADDLDKAEQALTSIAVAEPAEIVAVHSRVWREYLDPDGAEPRHEAIRERRAFHLGGERDGVTPFYGAADPVFAALLRSAFAEASGPRVTPRFLSDDDRERGTYIETSSDGTEIEKLRDPRTREQRQYDVFTGLITAGLREVERPGAAGNGGSMRPTSTVMAVITLEALESGRGVGWLDDVDEPVPASTVQQLACDAGYRPIVLGREGEVLYLGHPQRLFSPAQRKALAVRDGGCVWPGCTAPPQWTEAHHVIEHERGGPTDIDNGALLCSPHHHLLHSSAFTMKMIRGRPHLLAPPWLDPEQKWKLLGRTRATMAPCRDVA